MAFCKKCGSMMRFVNNGWLCPKCDLSPKNNRGKNKQEKAEQRNIELSVRNKDSGDYVVFSYNKHQVVFRINGKDARSFEDIVGEPMQYFIKATCSNQGKKECYIHPDFFKDNPGTAHINMKRKGVPCLSDCVESSCLFEAKPEIIEKGLLKYRKYKLKLMGDPLMDKSFFLEDIYEVIATKKASEIDGCCERNIEDYVRVDCENNETAYIEYRCFADNFFKTKIIIPRKQMICSKKDRCDASECVFKVNNLETFKIQTATYKEKVYKKYKKKKKK